MKKLLGLMAGAIAGLSGCAESIGEKVVKTVQPDGTIVKTITKTIFEQDYTVLNVIGGLAAFLAFASIMLRAFGAPIPAKSTWAAVLCAAGAWIMRSTLHNYMWLFTLMCVGALVFSAAAFAYGHLAWIERKTGLDINRDGKVGE